MTTAASMVTTDPRHATPRFGAPPQEVAPGVLMHANFSNSYAVKTSAGLLLVDPGLVRNSRSVHQAVRAWSDLPLHTAVYTHGHIDHAMGLGAFLAAGERPHIVAQENCPARFRRYQLTHGLNLDINRRQFGRQDQTFPTEFDWPTLTFADRLVQQLGDTEVRYASAKGETDDCCIIWLPERGLLFTGDLIIWRAPNCGNPQKVQRYPVEWCEALETMAGLDAEYLLPGHGMVIHGRDAVRLVLTETAQYLRHIIDQVLPLLNAGETPEAVYHAVASDPELAARPYLLEYYDHPKFIVRNLIRQWGGWWNGNAADLMPATFAAQAAEVAALAGGIGPIVARGRVALASGDLERAQHQAEWASRAAPADRDAQAFKRDVYAARLAATQILMAQGIYRAAANDARAALGEPPLQRDGRPL